MFLRELQTRFSFSTTSEILGFYWNHEPWCHHSTWKNLSRYFYKIGHKLKNGKYVWGEENFFTSAPNPGQNTLQRVVIYGDMGKVIRTKLSKCLSKRFLKCDEHDGTKDCRNFLIDRCVLRSYVLVLWPAPTVSCMVLVIAAEPG